MKYAIYGVNRVSKDFIYFFNDLEISVFFADTDENASSFANIVDVPVLSDDSIKKNSHLYDKIIVCDFNLSEKIKFLKKIGLQENIDFYHMDKFIESIDSYKLNPANRNLMVWGIGVKGEAFYKWNSRYSNYKIDNFVDQYCSEKEQWGYDILRPDSIVDWENNFVVIAVKNNNDIVKYLQNKGLVHYNDFCTYEEMQSLPSHMLRKTLLQKEVYDFSCRTMLNHVEIDGSGNVIDCCSTFIENSIGHIDETHDFEDSWNSTVHKIKVLSNVNRTYSFCLTHMCPLFVGRKKTYEYDLDTPYKKMEEVPRTAAVSLDYTCNLKCITCRDDYRVATKKEQERYRKYIDIINKKILPGCEFLVMAGDGEVLLSPIYQSIYTNENMKSIKWFRLLTNGLLFTHDKWKEIRRTTNAKIMMTVSIDAATAETYSRIRRGGNFAILKKNMEFAASLRKSGELSYLRFNFVVQKLNYKEMPLFIQWGTELGIDEIFFTKILNWGTYSKAEFKEISMMEEDGVTPKKELQEILDMDIVKNSIADLGTIRCNHKPNNDDVVDNYYRWELERSVQKLFS